jgi:murein DD-endopeptidase MepM/ murein hydrolase activator NlpD
MVLAVVLTGSGASSRIASSMVPAGKTYFTMFVGLSEPFDLGADCLEFSETEICPSGSGGGCGSWSSDDRGRGQFGFDFRIREETGRKMDGRGRVDRRGKGSSIAGAGRVRTPVSKTNFAFSGRATGRAECARLLAEVEGEWNNLVCAESAVFDQPTDSAYALPYLVGTSYRLSQSYCHAFGGHHRRYAYDFAMAIGDPVVAVRDGVVWRVQDSSADGEPIPGAANHVYVEHDDGSVAFYSHLQQGSAVVEPGDRVGAGQLLAASGNSGITGGVPHLHLEIYRGRELRHRDTVPVNFRNAEGPLDERGGLVAGAIYRGSG